jgi:hypothetical protein
MKVRMLFALASVVMVACTAMPAWSANEGPQKAPVFSDPTLIFNPYLPLTTLSQDILIGVNGKSTAETIRTRQQGIQQFVVNGQVVDSIIVEDDNYIGGQLIEVTQDYFCEDDNGTVYYMGEYTTTYKNGQVTGHAGSWLYGVDTTHLGTLLPGHPKVGMKWMSEDVPSKNLIEHDTAISTTGYHHRSRRNFSQLRRNARTSSWRGQGIQVVLSEHWRGDGIHQRYGLRCPRLAHFKLDFAVSGYSPRALG